MLWTLGSSVAEACDVAAAARALEVATAAPDLGADLGAVFFQATVTTVAAAVVVADLVAWTARREVVQANPGAATIAVAVGTSRAATLGVVAASCAAEPAAADGSVPVAALTVAFEPDTFGNRRLGGAGKDGRPGIATPRGLGIVENDRAGGNSAEAEQRFQQGASRAAPSIRASDLVESAIVHRSGKPFRGSTIDVR